jgi:hypothetical protein
MLKPSAISIFNCPEYFTSSTGFPLIFPAENVKLYGSGSRRSSNQLWRYFFQAGKLGAGGHGAAIGARVNAGEAAVLRAPWSSVCASAFHQPESVGAKSHGVGVFFSSPPTFT